MDAELRKRIEQTYSQAASDMEKKFNQYMKDFARKDAKKRKLVDAGLLSKEDYIKWRKGQVLVGKRWREMRDVLAQDLTNVDNIALSIINGYLPEAYALGHAYGTFLVEKASRINTSYTLYNREAVQRLIKHEPRLLPVTKWELDAPKDLRWNQRHITQQITQGILQGESLPQVAKRLRKVTGMDERAAMRNARTALTGAQNAGRIDAYKRGAELGIKVEKEWLATMDNVTRDSHIDMDGEHVPLNENFSNGLDYPGGSGPPEEVYNCFVGSTKIASDSEIVRSYCHEYEGELIEIETASGVSFTCTPNHPILSDGRWIGANLLNEGDNISVASIGDCIDPRRNPDINHVFPRMDTLHELLDKVGGKRTRALRVNFHGDVPASNVEVIAFERFLRDGWDSFFGKRVYKFLLKLANKAASCESTFLKHLLSIWLSALCFVCCVYKPLAFFWRSLGHAKKHGFRSGTRRNANGLEPEADNAPADTVFFREPFDGLSCKVFPDKIIHVNRVVSKCHVYNLQTDHGYYFVNSIISQNGEKCNCNFAIVHNCRCTVIPRLLDQDYSKSDLDRWRDPDLGDMSYDEWKETHAGRDSEQVAAIEHQVAQGKDISITWERRPDQFAFAIEDVINAQGFDGLPQVVSQEEFDKAVEESNFIAQRVYSAPDQETLDMYRSQLYGGKWYVDCSNGGAAYGKGMYSVYNNGTVINKYMEREMNGYRARRGAEHSYTETFTLLPDAKTITPNEIIELRRDAQNRLRDEFKKMGGLKSDEAIEWASSHDLHGLDDGSFAALMGYDAILTHGLDDYAIVLNRTKCIFLGG